MISASLLGNYDVNDIFLLSETEAYTVEDFNAIYYTDDAGKTWKDYSFVTGNWYLGIAILRKNHILAVGSPAALYHGQST